MSIEVTNVKKITDTEIVLDLKHPELGWIPYTALAHSGEEFMQQVWNEAIIKATTFDIDTLKARKYHQVLDVIETPILEMKRKYTETEQSIWDAKRSEAEKVLAGEVSPLIEAEASINGETTAELAKKILDKSNAYRIAIVKSEALKKKAKTDFDNVKTLKELQQVIKFYGIT